MNGSAGIRRRYAHRILPKLYRIITVDIIKSLPIPVRHNVASESMAWLEQLPENRRRGSRPRCILLVDGNHEEVADCLTRLVDLPDVVVSSDDKWMPYGKPVRRNGVWDKSPANEAQLDKARNLMSEENRRHLREWWLAAWGRGGRVTTPNWDIASTCRIEGQPGLLLIEAKAHENELDAVGKRLSGNASENSQKNHTRIGRAIRQARTELQTVTGGQWAISRDNFYQLSNRFAWSWKLVSIGIPVVLLYLGFLSAEDMSRDGPLFRSAVDWEQTVKGHCHGIVPDTCWSQRWDFGGVPFYPLIRVVDQPFNRTR